MKASYSLRYTITGEVQGVGYRLAILKKVQKELPTLIGYVKNNINGSVEVVATGNGSDHEHLMKLLYEGSRVSSVTKIEKEDYKSEGLNLFEIR